MVEIIGPTIASTVVVLYLWYELRYSGIESRFVGNDNTRRVTNNLSKAIENLADKLDHARGIFYTVTGCVCSSMNNPTVLKSFKEAGERGVDIRIIILHPEAFYQEDTSETLLNLVGKKVLRLAIAPPGYEKIPHYQIRDTLLYLEDPHPHVRESNYTDARIGTLIEKATPKTLNPQIESFLNLWNRSKEFGEQDAPSITVEVDPWLKKGVGNA